MKKTLKKIGLFILILPFALLLLATIGYLAFALYAVGGESAEHQAYLKKNMQEVRLGADNRFGIFDETFYANKVFLLGEVHGYAMPQELDFELLKHLNQTLGLKYYLAEVDYSQAHFLNEYLRTGDEALLRYVFQTWVEQNAQWGNQNFYQKLQKIYDLNKSLPDDRKIRIFGVDKIQDIAVTKRHLGELLQNKQEGIVLDSLTKLVQNDADTTEMLPAFASRLMQETDMGKPLKEYMASGQTEVQHILQNLAYRHDQVKRDSVMFLNMASLTTINNLQNEQFYGMWGIFHTLQTSVNNGFRPFAALLKYNESPFKGKVVSINILANDSENMIPARMMPEALNKGNAYVNTTWVNNDGPLVFVDGIKDLKAVTKKNSITIFKVDAENSPYRTSSRLAETTILIPNQGIKPDAENPTITQACQYVVLIRNSKALTPIKTLL
ncbi:hypothetical protein [uncultured Pontibacter sp.]|uniref:hypothetical protein n=1 Tax=uncultured Pontibacter sp. TaxID=453356 RepID=UPI002619BCE3|nr:hypothetical protein [uncultured Pontibacter sp.]